MTVGTDKSRFETRFGFRFKQPLVRLRFLDEGLSNRFGFSVTDLATPLDQFRSLTLAGTTVLIVENEMTFSLCHHCQRRSRYSALEMVPHCFRLSLGSSHAGSFIGEI
jgi:hypothetical protein